MEVPDVFPIKIISVRQHRLSTQLQCRYIPTSFLPVLVVKKSLSTSPLIQIKLLDH